MDKYYEFTELQFVEPRVNSDKFYRVFTFGNELITQYGRNGTFGVFSHQQHSSPGAAIAAGAKIIKAKSAKGYQLITSGPLKVSANPSDGELDRAASLFAAGKGPVLAPHVPSTTPAPAAAPTRSSREEAAEAKAIASILGTVQNRKAAVAAEAGIDADALDRVRKSLSRHFKARIMYTPTSVTRPMLAHTISADDVERHLDDPTWGCQPKLDGDRVVIEVLDGVVSVLNRSGQPKVKNVSDAHTAPFRSLTAGRWVFDGEVVGRKLWLFDMPAGGLHDESTDFSKRHLALVLTLDALNVPSDSESIGLVAVTTGTEDKRELLRAALEAGKEGIIFRLLHASYSAGRSMDLLKHKFVKEADCEVVAVDPVKDSVTLGVRDGNGEVQIVGGASTIGKGEIAVGDVVEVRFLYVVDAANPRMYQPRIMRLRTDKAASECSIEQFKDAVTDKTVEA